MNKAVFLDRDGILNIDEGYVTRKEDLVLIPEAQDVLKHLKDLGYNLFVVSNQPVIARGLATIDQVNDINNTLNELLGGYIDKFYFCPHHPNANLEEYRKVCDCRKPRPGLINQGIKEFDLDVDECWMIGDRISDTDSGNEAGCKTILLEKEDSYHRIVGNYSEENIDPNYKIKSIKEVIEIISE